MQKNHFSWRVLIAAVFLPAAIAGVDQLGIDFANSQRWRGPATVIVFGGFMLQTALLSQAIDRWLPNWHWRFGVLAWALVLTNLLLFRAIVEGSNFWFWSDSKPVQLLTNAFLAAQMSAVAVCFILVALPLGKKTLIAAASLAPPAMAQAILLANQIGYYRAEFWAAVMLIQLMATISLAAGLRPLGWQIVRLDAIALASPGACLQFSIRHILIATTAAALFTAFGKVVITHSAGGIDWKQWLQGAIDGCVLAVLSLAAVWAALGTGRTELRLPVLLLLAALLAGLLWWAERTTATLLLSYSRLPYGGIFWFRETFAGPWWLAWTLLAGTFLASWLSVLRATGYRLVRQRTGSS